MSKTREQKEYMTMPIPPAFISGGKSLLKKGGCKIPAGKT